MKRLLTAIAERVRRRPSGTARQGAEIDPELRAQVVDFLREWLPDPVRARYREMIAADPEGWHRDAHFRGIVVEHLLEGNGITARALGIENLEEVWPDLLEAAVADPQGTQQPSPEHDHPSNSNR